MEVIVRQFFPKAESIDISLLGAGLIHQTYKITILPAADEYVLQNFSTRVFRQPYAVYENYIRAAAHLRSNDYPYLIPEWIMTRAGNPFYIDNENRYWRLSSFVSNSIAYEHAPSYHFLAEASSAFGKLLRHLGGFAPENLKATIPNFHDLEGRFRKFRSVVKTMTNRLATAERSVSQIFKLYETLDLDFSALPIRATHNDCKLSNLLFHRKHEKCLAVIDWDTLMPGYVVTDFGDMVRSMCASASESERDLDKVYFIPEDYRIIKTAFLAATADWITSEERNRLFDGGLYIVLEQAVRFLSDYLEGDPYYGESYSGQNLDRANNQIKLLESMVNYKKETP